MSPDALLCDCGQIRSRADAETCAECRECIGCREDYAAPGSDVCAACAEVLPCSDCGERHPRHEMMPWAWDVLCEACERDRPILAHERRMVMAEYERRTERRLIAAGIVRGRGEPIADAIRAGFRAARAAEEAGR